MRYLLSLCLLISIETFAQNNSINKESHRIKIVRIAEEVQIDGALDESFWSRLEVQDDFIMQQPTDGKPAAYKTEVRIAYDERNIYISAVCFDDPDLIIQTLKRDEFGQSDEFAVFIDPVNQQTNGYVFGVNAMGSMTEALIFPGDGDESWDNRWYAEVKRHSDRWVIEMSIPFKSIRFKDGSPEWGINFFRNEPGRNESYVWAPIPRQFDALDLGYFGTLEWDQAISAARSNVSLIPYTSYSVEQVQNRADKNIENFDAGLDAKISLSPTLNLDLTVNPDFSQVEVDDQVINLTRFNIFFPEKRQFFIENSDVFNAFGQGADRPFYSRRIGLDAGGNRVPILYGARLSGNLDPNSRIGLINMHTRASDVTAEQNYTALAFQRRIFKRSEIKGIFLNRQGYDGGEAISGDYGRNLGAEFAYSKPDGSLTGNLGYLHSYKAGIEDKNQHFYGEIQYNGQEFRSFLQIQKMGENYSSEMGFNGRLFNYDPSSNSIVRIGYTSIGNMLNYYIYPKESKSVNVHWSGLENFVWVNEGTGLNQWYTRLRHFIIFKNTSELRFRVNNNFTELIYPFGITEVPLPVGDYNMTEYNIQFNTDRRNRLNTQWFIVYGGFYNGTKLTFEGSVDFRIQPWGSFSVGVEHNAIRLPQPYGDIDITLATGKFEINFANNLFWTSYLQYNTQADNFNINSRFQWRFAPMSDLFLVYTDNYMVEGKFGPKNRTMVLKFNYWLSL